MLNQTNSSTSPTFCPILSKGSLNLTACPCLRRLCVLINIFLLLLLLDLLPMQFWSIICPQHGIPYARKPHSGWKFLVSTKITSCTDQNPLPPCFFVFEIFAVGCKFDNTAARNLSNAGLGLVSMIRALLASPKPCVSHKSKVGPVHFQPAVISTRATGCMSHYTHAHKSIGFNPVAVTCPLTSKDSISHNHLHTHSHKHRYTFRTVDSEAQWSCSRDYDWQKEICECDWCSVS